MAEVDQLIFAQLKAIGVGVGKVSGVADFDAPLFYKAVREWMEHLYPALMEGLPAQMPQSMNKKFKASGAIAACVQEAGYPQQVTFNQFMYPDPKEMRGVLLWLCEQQNAEDARGKPGPLEGDAGERDIAAEAWQRLAAAQTSCADALKERRAASSVVYPPLKGCYGSAAGEAPGATAAEDWRQHDVLHPFITPADDEEFAWCLENLKLMVQQAENPHILASINAFNMSAYAKEVQFERLAEGARGDTKLSKKELKTKIKTRAMERLTDVLSPTGKDRVLTSPGSRSPGRKGKFLKDLMFSAQALDFSEPAAEGEDAVQSPKESTPQESLAQQKLKELKLGITQVNKEINGVMKESNELEEQIEQLTKEREETDNVTQKTAKTADVEEAAFYEVEKARELMGSEDPLGALQGELAERQGDLGQIEDELNAKVAKLEAKYDAIQKEMEAATATTTALQKRSDYLKDKIKTAKQASKEKKTFLEELEEEQSKLTTDVDRDHFVNRIFDILKNIRKQDAEVRKITEQSRDVTREISDLQRAVAKELDHVETACLEHDDTNVEAKTHGRLAHQEVQKLHAAFDGLRTTVEEQGAVRRQTLEYDERTEKQTARNAAFEENAKLVARDLEEVKRENAAATKELKKLRERLRM